MVLLLLLLALLVLNYRFQKKELASFTLVQSERFYWLRASLLLAAIFFGYSALQEKTPPQTLKQNEVTEVRFLLDTSTSMAATDTTLGQSRLQEAKQIIEQITTNLAGQKVSLAAFTEDVELLVPPTNDTLFLKVMLEYGTIAKGGTDLVATFKTLQSKREGQNLHVILLSDGEDEVKGRTKEETLSQIGALFQQNPLSLTAIGLGTKAGAPIPNFTGEENAPITSLQEEVLRTLSKMGNGQFFIASDYTAASLGKMIAQKLTPETIPTPPIKEQNQGADTLVLLAIFSAAGALLLRPD